MKEQNVFSSTEIYGKEAEEFSASNIYASNSTEKKKGERKKLCMISLSQSITSFPKLGDSEIGSFGCIALISGNSKLLLGKIFYTYWLLRAAEVELLHIPPF